MSGRNAQIRTSFEASEGVPGTDYTYLRFQSESLDMEYTPKPDPNIDPSGNEGESEILEAHGSGSISGAFNSESMLKLRAHMHGYNETAQIVAGVQLWELRDLDVINDTPVAYYKDSMNFGIWRDEAELPKEYSVLGAKASQMQLTVGAGEFAIMQHDFLFSRDSFSRHPFEQAVAAGWTGDIHVRGHRAAGDETGDYYKFKVPVGGGGALGVAKLVWGKGAAAYSATEYVTSAVMDVRNADDTLAGTRKVPYQILINFGGVFTAGDEWYIYPDATKPVATFSARPKLHGAAAICEFTLGGVTKTRIIEQFSLTHAVPREGKFGIGSIYDQSIGEPDNAQHWWEASFDASYINAELKQALLQSRTIAFYAKLWGAKIGATVHEDFAEFTLTNMKITNAGATIQNAGDNKESPVFRAFGATPCVEKWQNTITSITPP